MVFYEADGILQSGILAQEIRESLGKDRFFDSIQPISSWETISSTIEEIAERYADALSVAYKKDVIVSKSAFWDCGIENLIAGNPNYMPMVHLSVNSSVKERPWTEFFALLGKRLVATGYGEFRKGRYGSFGQIELLAHASVIKHPFRRFASCEYPLQVHTLAEANLSSPLARAYESLSF